MHEETTTNENKKRKKKKTQMFNQTIPADGEHAIHTILSMELHVVHIRICVQQQICLYIVQVHGQTI